MLRLVGFSAVIGTSAIILLACGDTVTEQPTAAGVGGASASSGMGGTTTSDSAGTGAGAPKTTSECLGDHHFPIAPEYDQYEAVMGSHCIGTNHQDITGLEKLVFVGDSITQGTFPATEDQFYRTLLTNKMTAKYPGIEVVECAENGARMGDLQGQLDQCFPGVEPKTTLVVMTMGGNDLANWAEQDLDNDAAIADAERVAGELRDAVATIKDASKFPAGGFLVYANVYEFTDGTAELDSCPGAGFIGLSGTYYAGANALARLEELMMEIAVDTQTDMILMGEDFCGHGYNRDVNNTCYLGPDSELWFDLSCIHPSPPGHQRIADMFELVIDE